AKSAPPNRTWRACRGSHPERAIKWFRPDYESVFRGDSVRQKKLHIVRIGCPPQAQDSFVRDARVEAPEPPALDPVDRESRAGRVLPQRSREESGRALEGDGILPRTGRDGERDRGERRG